MIHCDVVLEDFLIMIYCKDFGNYIQIFWKLFSLQIIGKIMTVRFSFTVLHVFGTIKLGLNLLHLFFCTFVLLIVYHFGVFFPTFVITFYPAVMFFDLDQSCTHIFRICFLMFSLVLSFDVRNGQGFQPALQGLQ